MRSAAWVSLASAALLITSSGWKGEPLSSLGSLKSAWWTGPLFASAFSIVLMGVAALGRKDADGNHRVMEYAYAVPGTSLALLNAVPSFGLAAFPPFWVGVSMLGFLFIAAMAYYHVSRERDDPPALKRDSNIRWESGL